MGPELVGSGKQTVGQARTIVVTVLQWGRSWLAPENGH